MYVKTLFGRPMLCEAVSLQERGFIITLEAISVLGDYQDYVLVQHADRKLPIGVDKELGFHVAENKCSISIYEPPSEFTFDSWQDRPVPFNVGAVGKELIEVVKERKNSRIVLYNHNRESE